MNATQLHAFTSFWVGFRMFRMLVLLAAMTPLAGHCYFSRGSDIALFEESASRIDLHKGSEDDFNKSYMLAGYITAIHDAYVGKEFCPSRSLKINEMEQIVFSYNNDHPEMQFNNAAEIVLRAFKRQYPCHG